MIYVMFIFFLGLVFSFKLFQAWIYCTNAPLNFYLSFSWPWQHKNVTSWGMFLCANTNIHYHKNAFYTQLRNLAENATISSHLFFQIFCLHNNMYCIYEKHLSIFIIFLNALMVFFQKYACTYNRIHTYKVFTNSNSGFIAIRIY